ncbi:MULTISPECIES: hypothetical protein [Pseudomonas]|uniref:hypothetical protein n=1 Tax=Pseudomonas TaxID=286 RepID=UPI0011DDCF49|nr:MULTISPECIES: hypothetical protein [Pseudomonas]
MFGKFVSKVFFCLKMPRERHSIAIRILEKSSVWFILARGRTPLRFWRTWKQPDKEQVMNRKIPQAAAASNPQDREEVLFSKEELLALSDAIKKSKTRVSQTKAASCAYHR